MHWHILGAGSIGLLWATKLSLAGFRVTLILRNQDKLEQLLREPTIRCGDEHFPVEAELPNSVTKLSNLLITTKAYDVERAYESVKLRITSDTKVLFLHNGLGPQQRLLELYPQVQLWAGTTTDGAYLISNFHVTPAGEGETGIGSLSTPEQDGLYQDLSCLPGLHHQPSIIPRLWQKLAINCAINPLTAIYNCKNGEVLSNTECYRLLALICEEVEQVATAQNIPLFETPLIEKVIEVATVTASNYSSMQQDVAHQRQTEIEFINGFLCEQARQQRIATPVNDAMVDKIRQISLIRDQ
jgi:2-dehydropantoate 2-reductase